MRPLGVAYLAAVVLIAIGMKTFRPSPTAAPKGTEMTWPDPTEVSVQAKPTGVWTWALDRVKGPMRILIEADGKWSYTPGVTCGPDGHLDSQLAAEHALMPTAPLGALLVKVGGSTAGIADGTIRVAGTKIYFEIDSTVSGPLLLTINDEVGGMSDNDGTLKVRIRTALIPAASAPATSPPAASAAAGDKDANGKPKPEAPKDEREP